MSGFVRNTQHLQESHGSDDLLGYADYASDLRRYLESITDTPCMIAFVGDHGIGKSFVLNKVDELIKEEDQNTYWFNFEAWRYSTRESLWAAFVCELEGETIDATSRHGLKSIKKNLRKFEKLCRGQSIPFVLVLLLIVAAIMLNIAGGVAFTEALPLLLAMFMFLMVALKVVSDHALYRQEGYEYLFEEAIRRLDQNGFRQIYIVLEDIDRSGDPGLLFLETTSYLLRNLHKRAPQTCNNLSIKVVAPLSRAFYDSNRQNTSLSKAIDHRHDFGIRHLNIDNFTDAIFKDEFLKDDGRESINDLYDIISIHDNHDVRLLKTILRRADNRYVNLKASYKFQVDHRICIAVEISKHKQLRYQDPDAPTTVFERAIRNHVIDDNYIARFLIRRIIYRGDEEQFQSLLRSGRAGGSLEIRVVDFVPQAGESGLLSEGSLIPNREIYKIAKCYFG